MNNPSSIKSEIRGYYLNLAFRSDQMPDQEDQQQEMNRSRLGQSAGMRLPWGNTRDLVPADVLSRNTPGALGNDGRHDRGIERQGGEP